MSRHQQWDIVTDVGLTALVVAAGRAVDTHRPDALIDDPWAERFVHAANPPVPLATRPVPPADESEDELWQMMSAYMGVRTRWFDEYFRYATDRGVRQVVILAAGLDSRALRLPWPDGTTVFEIDQPAVLAFKDEVIAAHHGKPTSRRVTVPVDLRDDWRAALLDAGFDPAQPGAWLAEGLLPYLPAEAETALLQTVDELSAAGSAFEIENFTNLVSQVQDPTFRRLATKFGVDMPALLHEDDRESATTWLARHGWQVETRLAADVAASYGRVLDPLSQRLNAKSEYLTATK